MSSYDFQVNEQIIGKAKAVRDQLGIIKTISGDGKKRKIDVLFADNKLRTMTIYGIKKSGSQDTQVVADQTIDGPDNEEDVGDGFIEDNEVSSGDSSSETNELNEAFIE